MMMLNIAAIIPCSESEGPGKRFVIWVQGCLKRCINCCNPHMLSIVPREIVCCDAVLRQVKQMQAEYGIEGVTLLGGEPMLQARGLSYLVKRCREAKLSVMVFTGYTLEELKHLQLPGADELIGHADILAAGPYKAAQPETVRNWVGSRNQHLYFLTRRYPPGIEYNPAYRPSLEFRVGLGGLIRMNGSPTKMNCEVH